MKNRIIVLFLFCLLLPSVGVQAAYLNVCESGFKWRTVVPQKTLVIKKRTLHSAVLSGDEKEVQYLFQLGLTPEDAGVTSDNEVMHLFANARLLEAAKIGNVNGLRASIENGANVNVVHAYEYEYTALMIASECGYAEVVSALLDAGADPNFQGSRPLGAFEMLVGITALDLAKTNNNLEVVEKLNEKGAKAGMVETKKIAKQSGTDSN